jgi:hypothetical protein
MIGSPHLPVTPYRRHDFMKYPNVFAQTKEYYQMTFDNMKQFQSENEKLVKGFIDRLGNINPDIADNYTQWLEIVKKGSTNYQDLVLKGLDYLSENYEKISPASLAKAS